MGALDDALDAQFGGIAAPALSGSAQGSGLDAALDAQFGPAVSTPPDLRALIADATPAAVVDPAGIPGEAAPAPDKTRFEDAVDRAAVGMARGGAGISTALAGMVGGPVTSGVFGPLPASIPGLEERTKATADSIRKFGDLLWEVSKVPDFESVHDDMFQKILNMGAETLPFITATTAATLVGGPFGGFAVGSMVEGGAATRTALDTFAEDGEITEAERELAGRIGIGVGIISGVIETLGGKFVNDKLMRSAIFGKLQEKLGAGVTKFTVNTIVEAIEEGTQEITQIGGEAIYKTIDIRDAVKRTLYAAGGGALLGGAGGAGRAAIGGGTRAVEQQITQTGEAVILDQEASGSALVKTQETPPTRSFIEAVTAKKNMSLREATRATTVELGFSAREAFDSETTPITEDEKTNLRGMGFSVPQILNMPLTEARVVLRNRQIEITKQVQQGASQEDAEATVDSAGITEQGAVDAAKHADTRVALTKVQDSIEASEQDPAPVIEGKAAAPRFTAPGLTKLITSKRLLMRRIGAEVITGKLTVAKERLEVLKSDLVRETNQVLKGLRKQASLGDKVSSRILNKNTKPVQQMVELLDIHERLPEGIATGLSPETVEAFNKLRDTTVWLRERANVAREKAGLPPIGDIKGYLPHWTNSMADEVINGTLPYSTGFLGRLMKGVSKSKLNKTALHRQVQQKIQKHMENDLGRLMRGLISYDLHDMLLANPQAAVWEELLALRKAGNIPEVVYNEISDYINYDILGRQTKYDRIFNNAAVVKTTTELVNKVLRPLNREITNPAMSYFGGARRMMHAAFLPFRLRPATRNLGQRLLNLSFFRGRDLLRAQFGKQDTIADPKTGEQRKVLDVVRDTDWYKLTKPEDTLDDNTVISTLTKVGMVPFKLAHVGNRYLSNVEVSALTAYYDWKYRFEQSHDTSSAHYKNIVKHSEKTRIPIDQLQTQKEDMMDDIRDGVQMTQWEYMSHSMPTIFRGQTNRALGAYQSWWMNYFTSMMGEGFHRLTTGRTRVRGNRTGGRLLTPYARTRVIKGMGGIYGMARIAKQTMGIAMIGALFLPDPSSGLPPLLSLASSMAKLLLGFDEPEKKKEAWKDIKKFGGRIIPFNAAIRDAAKVGDTWTLKDYVFYTNNEEWKRIWIPVEPKKKKRKGKF